MAVSRSRIALALTIAVVVGLALWWLGREQGTTGATTIAASGDGDARASSKRPVGADAEREAAARAKLRWQDRSASVAGTVREAGGGAIAGADVCAWIGWGPVPSAMQREPTCTTSAADGSYRLTTLAALPTSVSASAAEHIPAAYEHRPGDPMFQLLRGEAKTGVDIELAKGGVAIHGLVKDVSGGVIEGALVTNSASGWGGTPGRARTKSDEQGAFTLWVGPGQLELNAEAEGYAPAWTSGPAPGYTFELLLSPESVLAGVVVRAGDDGTPVANVRVDAGNDWGDDGGVAYTDDEGRFRIDRLGPGRYKPAAHAEDGYGRAAQSVHLGLGESAEDLRIELHPAATVRARILVAGDPQRPCTDGGATLIDNLAKRVERSDVDADGTIELLAVLPGSYEVSAWCQGTVSQDRYEPVVVAGEPIAELVWTVNEGLAITGIVVGPSGAPIAGASVSAQPTSAAPRGQVAGLSSELTAADGRFELRGLLPGSYAVRLSVRRDLDVVAPTEPVDVAVTTGATLDIRLEVAAAGTVVGRVVDQRGKPVVHARVRLRGDEHGYGGDASSRDDGTFVIEGVRAETYRASASRGTGGELRAPGTGDDDVQGERVVVKAGETASVELVVEDQSGRIRGRVLDEAGGPISDAFVHANRESESASASDGGNRRGARWGGWDRQPVLTDHDGAFELVDVAPGKHTVFATRKGGGEGLTEHVELGATDVVVKIDPGASISGTVALAGGGVPRRFEIFANERTLGFSRREEFFETGGAWTLDELPPGSYELAVEATEGRDTETLTLAEAGHEQGVAFELEPNVDVEGTVVDLETGEPVANISVSIGPRRGGSLTGRSSAKDNVSDAAGKFTVGAAPTGPVRINLSPRTWGDETYRWTIVQTTIPSTTGRHVLAPIGLPKSRLSRSKQAGDLGLKLEQPPPDVESEDFPLRIAFIRPGGPAAATELAVGDVITGVDGHDVTGENHYRYGPLTRVPVGTKVMLEVEGGKHVAIVAGKPP